MFKFLLGVAFGAAGYWAWQSFGRDLLGLGTDQDTTYGNYGSGTTFSSGTSGTSSFGSSGSSSTSPSTTSSTPASSETGTPSST
jgi:hypothetical protein